ncbi:MAG: hypothetical protein CFE21_14955 [Bacteroidetes bacterium B1(2017)]|nr:MAG: hypothetical protein CFE21_14955 [Bacteroidetes bacterium B1(2017)]
MKNLNTYQPLTIANTSLLRHYLKEDIKYRFHFNGKESDKEINGTGNDYDFGARIYDARLGKWFSLDAFQDVYIALSPYTYAADNPINIIDRAGHLLKDKNGNIIATPTGNTVTRQSGLTYEENGKTYKTITKYQEVVIYTDKGTPIKALRKIESYVEEKGDDGNFTRVQKEPKPGSESNCHGYTFAGGQLVIEEKAGGKAIRTILKEDGYVMKEDGKPVSKDQADGFVEVGKGEIMHTGTKSGKLWSADHGDGVATENVSLLEAQSVYMKNPNAEMKFFKNGTSNNQNIKGVNVMDKKDAESYGAKTNEPIVE